MTSAKSGGDRTPPGAVRSPAWVAHVVDDSTGEARAVLLHLPSGERVALSATATRVWQLIVAGGEGGARLGEIVPLLADEYGAEPATVDRDVSALVTQLLAAEWVEEVAGDSTGALAADAGRDQVE